jgi:hypothetical protein
MPDSLAGYLRSCDRAVDAWRLQARYAVTTCCCEQFARTDEGFSKPSSRNRHQETISGPDEKNP